jgi:membrane-associated phospholipid phosphatase
LEDRGLSLSSGVAEFFRLLGVYITSILPFFVVAWLLTWVLLIFIFRLAKAHLRPRILKIDDEMRAWAKTLRYRVATETVADKEQRENERNLLTWFFRFWTNFASAPSLSLFSLLIPLWMYARAKAQPNPFDFISLEADQQYDFQQIRLWLLPGLCYAGSMYLSYTLKRVFKRLRPPRNHGAFGHKLKDGSFPSGHSLTSFCFWLMLTVSLALAGAALPVVFAFGGMALAIVLLTGLSRIYLGVHFPSDVAGGYIIGVVWCAICFAALHGRI